MSDDDKDRWIAAGIMFVGGFVLVAGGAVALNFLLTVHPNRWTTAIWLTFLVPVVGLSMFLFGVGLRVWAWLFETDEADGM